MPVIPGTYGGGANNHDAAPGNPFPKTAQMAGYGDKPAIPGRIPGAYGEGANNDDAAPATRFKVGMFDNGEPADGTFEKDGVPGGIKGGW